MSDPRAGGQGSATERNVLHDRVVGDETPDERYANGMTNQAKTHFVCQAMRYPDKAFDLDLPFPVEEWAASDDNALICAGLYLSDLRVQFYSKCLAAAPANRQYLWPKHAEAEYWHRALNALIFRRLNGAIYEDWRTLH